MEIFKILLGQCYDAKDSLDLNKKTPMDYAEESGNIEIVQYCKSVTHVLFSRDFQKIQNRASRKNTLTTSLGTKDFKRIAVLGHGAYAEVMLV